MKPEEAIIKKMDALNKELCELRNSCFNKSSSQANTEAIHLIWVGTATLINKVVERLIGCKNEFYGSKDVGKLLQRLTSISDSINSDRSDEKDMATLSLVMKKLDLTALSIQTPDVDTARREFQEFKGKVHEGKNDVKPGSTPGKQ